MNSSIIFNFLEKSFEIGSWVMTRVMMTVRQNDEKAKSLLFEDFRLLSKSTVGAIFVVLVKGGKVRLVTTSLHFLNGRIGFQIGSSSRVDCCCAHKFGENDKTCAQFRDLVNLDCLALGS